MSGNWGDEYPYDDSDEGISWFSLFVIGFAFVALAIWGVWVALHPLVAK